MWNKPNDVAIVTKTVTNKIANIEKKSTKTDLGKNTVYKGVVLAGTTTPYLEFTSEDYMKAKADGKVVLLNFYADWCPVCRAEEPDLKAGFDALKRDDVVGFRVNYNDPDTDEIEKMLAREHGITYQHTKVIIKDNKQVLKNEEVWDRNHVIEEINKVQ